MNSVGEKTHVCSQGWIVTENGLRPCPVCAEENRRSAWLQSVYRTHRGLPYSPEIMSRMARHGLILPKFAEASKVLESKILKGPSFKGKTSALKTLFNQALEREGGSLARILWTTEDEIKPVWQDEEEGPDWVTLNLIRRKPRWIFLDEFFVEANHLDGRSDRDRSGRFHTLYRRFFDLIYSRSWDWEAVIITTNNDYREVFTKHHPANDNTQGLINRVNNITQGRVIE